MAAHAHGSSYLYVCMLPASALLTAFLLTPRQAAGRPMAQASPCCLAWLLSIHSVLFRVVFVVRGPTPAGQASVGSILALSCICPPPPSPTPTPIRAPCRQASFASRMSHSCTPNCQAGVVSSNGKLTIAMYTKRAIVPGERVARCDVVVSVF